VALVTGASSGIGEAVARALARRGYAVVLVARGADRLAAVARAVRGAGGTALELPGDARDRAAVATLIDAAFAWHGRLDVVVANAGVYYRGLATELTPAILEAALRDNFWVAFQVADVAVPRLVAQGQGHLVFVNSFDARKALPMDAAYVVAKSALAGYAAALRQALRPLGVHVCSVFPGRVDTPMIAGLEVPWVSRKVPPARVAAAIVRAVARRRPEVIVPARCRLLLWADVLSPRLSDWLVRRLRLDGRVASP